MRGMLMSDTTMSKSRIGVEEGERFDAVAREAEATASRR